MYWDDRSRLGMPFFQAWRASRLVIEAGRDSMGWARKQTIDYLLAKIGATQATSQ
jgi:uncharacterized protein (DUF885 family)